MTDFFGPIVTRTQVVDAVIATLQVWQREYLAEIERQQEWDADNEGHLPLMADFVRSVDGVRARVGTDLPCVIVRCPGLADDPVRRKTGTTVRFAVVVTVVASGGSQEETERLADLYTAAFRALLDQHKTLEGFASSLTWTDERYDELGQSQDRDTLGAGSAFYEVEVENVVHSYKGPKGEPLTDPYGTIREPLPTLSEDGVGVTTNPIEGE